MKTHSLAKALRLLADALEAHPNKEVSDLDTVLGVKSEIDTRQVAINLKTLHSLSKINKRDWVKLIQGYGFKIDFKPRDSSRNIMGKLLNYLDANPEAVDTLKRKAKETSETPSALSRALDILLKDL
jgi:hypothetical protein